MWQETFNWIWFVLLIVIIAVRKWHERQSGRRIGLQGPFLETALMVLWGAAAGVLPLLYLFSGRLDFADLPFGLPSLVGFAGAGLFVLAIWLLHRSHVDLGKQWSPAVEPGPEHHLVTHGIYRRIRHPMYAAHLCWGAAQALLLPNLLAGPLALLLLLVIFILRIPREERAMLAQFGDEYRRYMERTGRILPKFRA